MKKTVLFLFCCAAVLFGVPVSDTSAAAVSGKAYILYGYDNSRSAMDYNSFDISRIYLNYKETISDKYSVRVTTDISRFSGKQLDLYIKYCYFAVKDVYPGVSLKVGQADTPWIGYEDKLWSYRFLAKNWVDDQGILSSADTGLFASAKLPVVNGELALAAINGVGYKGADIDKYKTLQARLSITPLPDHDLLSGLTISGFGSFGYEATDRENTVVIGMIGYKADTFTLGGEGIVTTEPASVGDGANRGEGGSVFGKVKLIDKTHAFARWDCFDSPVSNKVVRAIAGLSHELNDRLTIALSNQQEITKQPSESIENLILINTEVKF